MTISQTALPLMVTIAGMLVAGLAFTVGYQYLSSATLASQTGAQQETLESARQQAADRAHVQEQGQQLEAKVTRRPAAWSWSEQFPIMVTQVSPIIEKSGTKVDAMQPVSPVERNGIMRFPLRLTLRTDLASLTTMLQQMKKASPALVIDQFAIRTGRQPDEPLQVQMTLSSYIMVTGSRTTGDKR